MTNKKPPSRVQKQREIRVAAGWQEVKVWVPTEKDAEDIRNLADERRKKAEALEGLHHEVKTVTLETQTRIAQAIAEHGSAAYTHSSGAVLDLMTKLADEDDLQSFSRAFIILARAKPTNAASVASFIPAKINNFLVKHRGVDPRMMMNWIHDHPEWTERLKDAVRDPARFEVVVETMAQEMKRPH
jgi:hypothetical protein